MIEGKWNSVFLTLEHTIYNVCKLVEPIAPNIKHDVYIDYFLKEIDFDTLCKETDQDEILKNCTAIYFGLDNMLQVDISNEIRNFQNNISKLSSTEILEIRLTLIQIIGDLKRQTRENSTGTSFAQRYNLLWNSIKAKKKLLPIDYQILITHFAETISNDLLSSYDIINETLKEVAPLLKEQDNNNITDIKQRLKVPQIALIYIYSGKHITEENATEIAAKYGYNSKTSGKGLYHDYLKYYNPNDRKALPTNNSKKTLSNKIELFESVVSYLTDKAKERTNDEIKILKTLFEKEYS